LNLEWIGSVVHSVEATDTSLLIHKRKARICFVVWLEIEEKPLSY